MGRFLAGVVSALLLVAAGVFAWKSIAGAEQVPPSAPKLHAGTMAGTGAPDALDPPMASEKTREEKRFSRYDKDRNGLIGDEEYLASRRKAFAKLDLNGDGRLAFEEWSKKSIDKFRGADSDRSRTLTAAEFATTRPTRKAPVKRNCPPARQDIGADEGG